MQTNLEQTMNQQQKLNTMDLITVRMWFEMEINVMEQVNSTNSNTFTDPK